MGIIEDLKTQYRTGGIAQQLIFWNVGCFLASLVFFYQFSTGNFIYPTWVALSSKPDDFIWHPWTFLSYAFLHFGFLHLFFNMIVLNFASNLFLTFFNPKQLLGVYVLSAIFAGLIYAGGFYVLGYTASIVGASAAIMAILVAATTYRPLMDVRLMLLGHVKLWHITAIILLLDFMQFRLDNMGGHLSHLAGALFGFIYVKLLINGTDLSRLVTNIINFFVGLFDTKPSTPFKHVHVNVQQPSARTTSKIVTRDKTQQQIDEILDKISQSGYDCLTKEEKEFLFKAGK